MNGTEGTRWNTILFAVVAGYIAAFHVGKLPPAMSVVRAELGLSLVVGGWLVSAFAATGLALGIVAGSVADTIGHRRLTLIGLGALAVGSFAGSLAESGPFLLAARLVEGLGFLAVAVAAPSMVAQAAAAGDRALALGVWSTNVPAGVALMIVVSPLLLAGTGWRGLWQVTALVTAIWLVVLAAGTRRDVGQGQRQARDGALARNVRLTVSAPATWLLALCFGLFTFQWLAVMLWLPTFLIEERGMGSALAAVMTAAVVAVNVPGNLIAGWLLHRRFPRWILMAGSAAAMGLAAVGIFDPDLSDRARYALCLVFSAVGGMPPTAIRAAVPSFAPTAAQVGTTNGLLVQGLNLGNVVGPPALAAVVTAAGNWESGVGLMTAAAAAMTILSLGVGAIEHRQRKAAGEPRR